MGSKSCKNDRSYIFEHGPSHAKHNGASLLNGSSAGLALPGHTSAASAGLIEATSAMLDSITRNVDVEPSFLTRKLVKSADFALAP